jgi:serine/threonine-protein kinase
MRLADFGETDGPSLNETLTLFRQARQTPGEGAAIATLLARDAIVPLPDELALAVGRALLDRGEVTQALAILDRARTPSSRILCADLHEEAGRLAEALTLIEKVLIVDYEYPGAKERLVRLRQHLGLPDAPRIRNGGAATIVSARPKAPFTILREAGRGGAATIFAATDSALEREVALKAFHQGGRDRATLLHEAHMTSQLAGPGVIRVFDANPDDGWLAFEWAVGGSLRAALDKPDARLMDVAWLAPLAATLARIHDAGFVHLDLKPSNVLFLDDSSTVPTISDFGSARRTGEPAGSGSLGYVSPERRSGRAAHPDDDVYGFGRLVEDTLTAFGDATPSAIARDLTHVARACLGPSGERPKSGHGLAPLLCTRG